MLAFGVNYTPLLLLVGGRQQGEESHSKAAGMAWQDCPCKQAPLAYETSMERLGVYRWLMFWNVPQNSLTQYNCIAGHVPSLYFQPTSPVSSYAFSLWLPSDIVINSLRHKDGGGKAQTWMGWSALLHLYTKENFVTTGWQSQCSLSLPSMNLCFTNALKLIILQTLYKAWGDTGIHRAALYGCNIYLTGVIQNLLA